MNTEAITNNRHIPSHEPLNSLKDIFSTTASQQYFDQSCPELRSCSNLQFEAATAPSFPICSFVARSSASAPVWSVASLSHWLGPVDLNRVWQAAIARNSSEGRQESSLLQTIYSVSEPHRTLQGWPPTFGRSGGLAGAVSRTLTAPIDRLKFLSQVHRSSRLTLRQGWTLMANEGTVKAYFRGNGANVMKNIPETALKLTLNDRIKDKICAGGHNITLGERLTVAALSGAIAQAAIYPLEVVQTRLAATHGMYKGIMDVVKTLWQKEGPRALYRGVTPCLIGILPYAGLDITAFELMKDKLMDHYGALPPPYMLLACGMLSSSGAQTLAYPFGLVRTRLQMDALSQHPYSGMLDCFRQVVQKEGWLGLYKGFGMSLAKIAPAAGISWFIYEESKAFFGCQDETHHHRQHH